MTDLIKLTLQIIISSINEKTHSIKNKQLDDDDNLNQVLVWLWEHCYRKFLLFIGYNESVFLFILQLNSNKKGCFYELQWLFSFVFHLRKSTGWTFSGLCKNGENSFSKDILRHLVA